MSIEMPHLPQPSEADPALARLSALLSAPATERELSGLDAAMAGFRAAQVTPSLTPIPPRRPSMLSSLTRVKAAAMIAAATVGVGGIAAVAVSARHQPAATPNAHASVAATPTLPASASGAPTGTPAPSGTPVGPDASGSAAFGLCTAWTANQREGKALDAVAFKNLAAAAGGADKVAAYCETVTAPGASGDHPTGKPTDVPTGKPADAGKSADHGKPAAVPTGEPTDPGRPATVPTPTTTHPPGRPGPLPCKSPPQPSRMPFGEPDGIRLGLSRASVSGPRGGGRR